MAIEPYLFFNGRCEEAIKFYKKALGAEVLMLMRYKESPEPPPPGMVPPGWENKVMHTSLRIGNATGDGLRRLQRGGKFSGIFIIAIGGQRGRSRARFYRPLGWRSGADAAHEDLLVAALRHARGPLRRRLDDQRGALTVKATKDTEAGVTQPRNSLLKWRRTTRTWRRPGHFSMPRGCNRARRAGAHPVLWRRRS